MKKTQAAKRREKLKKQADRSMNITIMIPALNPDRSAVSADIAAEWLPWLKYPGRQGSSDMKDFLSHAVSASACSFFTITESHAPFPPSAQSFILTQPNRRHTQGRRTSTQQIPSAASHFSRDGDAARTRPASTDHTECLCR